MDFGRDIQIAKSNQQCQELKAGGFSQSSVQESVESQTEQYHLYIWIYPCPNWHRIYARISILAVFVSFSGGVPEKLQAKWQCSLFVLPCLRQTTLSTLCLELFTCQDLKLSIARTPISKETIGGTKSEWYIGSIWSWLSWNLSNDTTVQNLFYNKSDALYIYIYVFMYNAHVYIIYIYISYIYTYHIHVIYIYHYISYIYT